MFHFVFDDDCVEAFETLEKTLTSVPIVQPPDWNLPFEISVMLVVMLLVMF